MARLRASCGQIGVRAQVRRKRVVAGTSRIVVSLCGVVGFVDWCAARVALLETGAFNRSATGPK